MRKNTVSAQARPLSFHHHPGSFSRLFAAAALLLMLLSAGCATVGYYFPVSQVPRIQIGKTTQDEIRTMFGPPWRTGIEDGKRTWTYGRYNYSLFAETRTQDLVVRFDEFGVVSSYTYNSTNN
jgi:hypothetical protein